MGTRLLGLPGIALPHGGTAAVTRRLAAGKVGPLVGRAALGLLGPQSWPGSPRLSSAASPGNGGGGRAHAGAHHLPGISIGTGRRHLPQGHFTGMVCTGHACLGDGRHTRTAGHSLWRFSATLRHAMHGPVLGIGCAASYRPGLLVGTLGHPLAWGMPCICLACHVPPLWSASCGLHCRRCMLRLRWRPFRMALAAAMAPDRLIVFHGGGVRLPVVGEVELIMIFQSRISFSDGSGSQ